MPESVKALVRLTPLRAICSWTRALWLWITDSMVHYLPIATTLNQMEGIKVAKLEYHMIWKSWITNFLPFTYPQNFPR